MKQDKKPRVRCHRRCMVEMADKSVIDSGLVNEGYDVDNVDLSTCGAKTMQHGMSVACTELESWRCS